MKLLFTAALFCALPLAADQKLGRPLTQKETLTLAAIFEQPGSFVGKTVQVKGKVTEVCQMAGCWMNLTDDQGHLLRIKVQDGDIVFPKESVGKSAIAEGKLERYELTRDQVVQQAEHEAEESGRKFDPSSVKSGKTVYQIAGSGAVVLD